MAFWLREESPFKRYLLALALAAGAVALHWVARFWVGSLLPFLFFLPAVLIAAIFAGIGPAAFVLGVGAINAGLILHSASPAGLTSQQVAAQILFVIFGAVLILVGQRVRMIALRALEAERGLQLAQEKTGLGLFEIDLLRSTLFASPSLWRLVGQTPRAHATPLRDWLHRVHPDDLEAGRGVFRRLMESDSESYEHEGRIVLPGGHVRWILAKLHVDRDAQGRALRLRGACVDLTERKNVSALLYRTQVQLTQQVEDLQRLHAMSSRLLEMTDLRSQLETVLQTLIELHDSARGSVALYDKATRALRLEAVQGFEAGIMPLAMSFGAGLVCDSGQRVVVEDVEKDPRFSSLADLAASHGIRAVHCTPLISVSGEVLGVISVHASKPVAPGEREIRLADICARKAAVFVERAQAEATVAASEQRFRVVLEAAAVPFNVLRPIRNEHGEIVDFRWSYVNGAALTLLGRQDEDLVGKTVSEMLPEAWHTPGVLDHFAIVCDRREVREFDVHTGQAECERWFHVVASPLEEGVAVWYADVTERTRYEQSLQAADRRKDEFLATLAHELRNPLAPIRQAVQIAKSPVAAPAQKGWSLDVIERQVGHMALLLDDLLDVSRISSGSLRLRKARVQLGTIIDTAVETARPVIEARQHKLELDMPDGGAYIEADPLRMAQVVSNLLTNAAKYTNAGGRIRLSARIEQGEAAIRIADTGIGLSGEQLPGIFRMFSQVRPTHERSTGGLGIGLALAKALVELHDGSISVVSAGLGEGSEFTVRIPAGAMSEDAEQAVVPAAAEPRSPRRILIADDNRDAADSLATLLRLEGHQVEVAYDGEKAWDAFNSFNPEVALLDIGMPCLRGDEVARRIRRQRPGRSPQLIAITGWGQEHDKTEAMAAGFNHHITKPVDPRHLTRLIH